MKMLESVDVEIHLVVLAHPVVVYSQKRKLGQDVIDGGDSDLRLFRRKDFRRDHVSAGVSKPKHRLMYGDSLWCHFQSVFSK